MVKIPKDIISNWIEEMFTEFKFYAQAKFGPRDTEDKLNSTIVYMLENKERLAKKFYEKPNPKSYFIGYFKTAMTSRHIDALRKEKRITSYDTTNDNEDYEMSMEEYMASSKSEFSQDDHLSLMQALSQLNSMCRELVALKAPRSYTDVEIADLLAIPVGTVASRHNRCIKKLKNIFFGKVNIKNNGEI